jgi:hypothetical protein
MVQPWEIRAGNLIRVRDVTPRIDSLNATDRNGVTVFRVYAVDYDASSNTATLELDSGIRSFRRASVHHRRVRAIKPTFEERETTKNRDKRLERERKAAAKRRHRKTPGGHH